MVDVFVIHSGKDYTYVKENVEPYLCGKKDAAGNPIQEICHANILTLESGVKNNWKKDAVKKIKYAQMVLVIIGEDASQPCKSDTMGWEVREALRFNKHIVLHNIMDYPLPGYLYMMDRFTKQRVPVADLMPLSAIKERIDNYAKGYYPIFSSHYAGLEQSEQSKHAGELLAQYEMFQRSSEDLVARRQSVNSFYISANSAIVSLQGAVIGLVDDPAKFYVVLFMCLTGIILDISWISLLDAYGTLNGAKMKIISLIENELPVKLYDTEWMVMSDKLNNKKYRSFTDSEKRIPKIFILVFSIVILVFGICELVKLLKTAP